MSVRPSSACSFAWMGVCRIYTSNLSDAHRNLFLIRNESLNFVNKSAAEQAFPALFSHASTIVLVKCV